MDEFNETNNNEEVVDTGMNEVISDTNALIEEAIENGAINEPLAKPEDVVPESKNFVEQTIETVKEGASVVADKVSDFTETVTDNIVETSKKFDIPEKCKDAIQGMKNFIDTINPFRDFDEYCEPNDAAYTLPNFKVVHD